MMKYFLIALLIFATPAYALTPIAHTDVVPYQRIETGESFKFGVVAFSKAGIDRVTFTISGQGYSGGTKTATAMQLNTRVARTGISGEVAGWTGWPGVWEYYVTISASEFSSNGIAYVTPTVYGEDSGSRNLGATPIYVEGSGDQTRHYAYVNPSSGNDTTCTADSTSRCQTIAKAVEIAETANGGSSDWNIIYLDAGTYSSGLTYSPNTSSGWLTITRSSGATRDTVILDEGGTATNADLTHFKGITLRSTGGIDYVYGNTEGRVWTDGCKQTNTQGRWSAAGGNGALLPVRQYSEHYATDGFVTDTDRAYGDAKIVRNCTIYKIAEDAFQHAAMVLNVRMDDQDNGSNDGETNYYHSDSYQLYGTNENKLIYGYFATDAHYQGLYLRTNSADSSNIAFINTFVEMRSPGTYGGVSTILSSGTINGENGALYPNRNWNHFLMWNCSFPYTSFKLYYLDFDLGVNGSITNSSFIGNMFYRLDESVSTIGVNPTWLEYGNAYGNEALYNHYMCSDVDSDCSGGYADRSQGKSPDSSSGRTTHSEGGASYPAVLDVTDTSTYSNFGYPIIAGTLVDRISSASYPKLPIADMAGNARGSLIDIGALELPATDITPPTLYSATILSTGKVRLVFNETVSGLNDDVFNIDCGVDGTNIMLQSAAGSYATWDLTPTTLPEGDWTCTIDYTGSSVVDTSDNALVTFSGTSVTNNSEVGAADSTDPVATITTTQYGYGVYSVNQSVDLAGTASDNVAVSSVTCANDQGGTCTVTGTETWTATSDLAQSTIGSELLPTVLTSWTTNNCIPTEETVGGETAWKISDDGAWSEKYYSATVEDGEVYLLIADRYMPAGSGIYNGWIMWDFGSRTDTQGDGHIDQPSTQETWETSYNLIQASGTTLTVRLYSQDSDYAAFKNVSLKKVTGLNMITVTAADSSSNTGTDTIYIAALEGTEAEAPTPDAPNIVYFVGAPAIQYQSNSPQINLGDIIQSGSTWQGSAITWQGEAVTW